MASSGFTSHIGTLRAKEGLNVKIIQLVDKLETKDLKRLAFLFRINEREWESVFGKLSLAGLRLMQLLSKEHRLCLKLLSEHLQCCNKWVLSEEIDDLLNSDAEFCENDELLYQKLALAQGKGQPNTMDADPKLRVFLIDKTSELNAEVFSTLKQYFEDSIPDSEMQELKDNVDLYRSLSKRLALNLGIIREAFLMSNEVEIADSFASFIKECHL